MTWLFISQDLFWRPSMTWLFISQDLFWRPSMTWLFISQDLFWRPSMTWLFISQDLFWRPSMTWLFISQDLFWRPSRTWLFISRAAGRGRSQTRRRGHCQRWRCPWTNRCHPDGGSPGCLSFRISQILCTRKQLQRK
ncbi:hypothetical protein EGW08_016150 [Elysia chlorotica]|uniref:Uncharacterized protein n=1 Tax=Elysia chlorotica TaxID=188477 RepID=A0A3S1HBP4_ELYCH|nr:hypothetical protein EGW08_016150 [Elysia chlorotica]